MGEGAVGRQPRFQLFLLIKTEELVMMQASPARGLDLAKTFLPFLLALSIFSIVSGLDQSPDTQLVHGNVQRELSDHEMIRKEREALPKDQNGPTDNSKKKKQPVRNKKKQKKNRKNAGNKKAGKRKSKGTNKNGKARNQSEKGKTGKASKGKNKAKDKNNGNGKKR